MKNVHLSTVVLHVKSCNSQFKVFMKEYHFEEFDVKAFSDNHEIQLIELNVNDKHLFILVGKISVLNIEILLSRVSQISDDLNLTTLHFIDFNTLEISSTLAIRIFHNNTIKLMAYTENLCELLRIQKISQQGREVQASLEEKLNFSTQLNVIIDCEETKAKMLKLCLELNKTEGDLKPLWSKSTHDIGLFKQREAPGYPIKFKFPIKPEMVGKPPSTVKTAFVNNRLLEPAKHMLEALEEAKIIVRAYSKFNARTHFLLKPPKELTVSQWVEKGYGTAEDFVAGTLDNKGVLTVRMVHHFADLNERTINAPLYQPSTSEQLRRISPAIKFLSVIDVTAAFFSLLIDDESSEMTGFDSGIQRYQRYKYLRVPMGAGISKTCQDSALLHAISDVGHYLIYSDNIIIISQTKNSHFEHVKKILIRLREHGFKCKLSKANFFITKMVRLYGHILNLSEGTLSPDKDKLEALRSKAIPKNRKELKSFLGGLQFFGQLLPIAGNTLAILHQATRGKTFNWTEEHQLAYEAIILLLSKPGIIFVYRGDEDRPFRVAIDTSEFHTSFVVFQIDEHNDKRPIQYGIKTWGAAFADQIPEYRELLGIVFTLQALEKEYEHKRYPLIVYTDSLPLCLMNIAARVSRKIARIKLFIESLNWVILSWSPGTSELIALPDYFSRQREDTPTKLRKPGPVEKEISEKISNKIDTSTLYSGPKSSFLIDSLIKLPTKELEEIKDKTATLDENNRLVFVKNINTDKERDVQSTVTVAKLMISSNDAEAEVIKDIPRKSIKTAQKKVTAKSNGAKVVVSHPDVKEKISDIGDTVLIPEKQIENDSIDAYTNLFDVSKGKEIYKSVTREQNSIDILDYPDLINARDSNIIPVGYRRRLSGNGSLARWFNNFLNRAKYLDLAKLRQALEMDPYWKNIIDICVKQTKYSMGEKIFFLCDEILVCKIKINEDAFSYKICLPAALAYDTILIAHRQLLHCRGRKLVNYLRVYFEIRDIDNLVNHITRQCFICCLNQPQPAGGTRQPMMKRMMLVNRKSSIWFVDELQLVDKNTGRELAGFSKLLVAIDGFSNFIVIEPLTQQVTSELFIKFIQERIHQVFGPCEALVTDNDSRLSSKLVQVACSFLGIYKLESLPYSPRANLAELANKLLLTGLRNETLSLYMNPKFFHILLHNIVYLINSLVFTNAKHISPYLLMFGQEPRQDILQIYSTGVEDILDKNQYLKHLILINDVYTKMRIEMMDKRKYKDSSSKNKEYWETLNAGDIVTIRNPEKEIAKANWKIRPLYKSKFVIVRRTESSAFLRPLENVHLRQFFDSKSDNKPTPDFVYKCDITLLKKVTHLTLLHTNKVNEYYEHFMQTNVTPPPYYMLFDESSKTGLLRTWTEMNEGNEEILSELKEAEQILPSRNMVSTVKKCFKGDYRSKMIYEISKTFKDLQIGQVIIKNKKKVTFNPEVCVRSLIKPDIIFFCKRPKILKLAEEPSPTLRTIKVEGITYYCSCKACSKQLDFCVKNPCNKCFGNALQNLTKVPKIPLVL